MIIVFVGSVWCSSNRRSVLVRIVLETSLSAENAGWQQRRDFVASMKKATTCLAYMYSRDHAPPLKDARGCANMVKKNFLKKKRSKPFALIELMPESTSLRNNGD